MAQAPLLTVPSAAPARDRSEIEQLNEAARRVYGKLEAAWGTAPVGCKPGPPVCDEQWTAYYEREDEAAHAIRNLYAQCDFHFRGTTAQLRAFAHAEYLQERHQQLEAAVGRAVRGWSDGEQQAHARSHATRLVTSSASHCTSAVGLAVGSVLVTFERDASTLDGGARQELDRFASAAQRHPSGRLQVRGHAEPTETRPEQLGAARASAVTRYLVSQGIPPSRLIATSFGAALPIAGPHEDTGDNRRVDFEVVP